MNAKILFAVFFSALFSAVSFAGELSGRIIYLEGKNVVSHDLKTGNKEVVVSASDEDKVEYLVASEDGSTLAWHDAKEGKIYTKKLPDGRAVAVKVQSQIVPGVPRPVVDLVVPKITGLAISPDGERIAYSFPTTDAAFVQPFGQNTDRPVYLRQMGTCQAVNVFDARFINIMNPAFFGITPPRGTSFSKNWQCQFGMFGNVASYPPKAPYRPSLSDGSTTGYPMPPQYFNGIYLTCQQAAEKMGERSDAVISAGSFMSLKNWEKNKRFLALVRQTSSGFGPIHIYDLRDRDELVRSGKPGFYEIRCRFTSFYGLAWTPEGSLLIKGDAGAWKIPAEQIERGIQNSGVGIDTDSVNIANRSIGFAVFGSYKHNIAINNVLPVAPQPYEFSGAAKNICCDSEDSLFCLRPDGNIHRIKRAEGDKVLFAVQAQGFSFCASGEKQAEKVAGPNAPAAPGAAPVAVAKQNPPDDTPAVLKGAASHGRYLRPSFVEKTVDGKKVKQPGQRLNLWTANYATKTDSETGVRMSETHAFFDISANYTRDPSKKNGVEINFYWGINRQSTDLISYSLPEETDLQKIDPLKLKYTALERMPFSCFLNFGSVIVLNSKTLYLAVKPLKIVSSGYKLPKKMGVPDAQKKFFADGRPLEVDYNNWWLSSPRLEEEYNASWQKTRELMRQNTMFNAERRSLEAKKTLR